MQPRPITRTMLHSIRTTHTSCTTMRRKLLIFASSFRTSTRVSKEKVAMFDSDLGANENSVVRRRAFLPRKASTNWFRGSVSVVPEYRPPDSDRRGRVNRTAALRGIGPRDELEAMLAAQMVITHTLSMRVDEARNSECGESNQQDRRRHRDSRHVSAQVGMIVHKASSQVVCEHQNQLRKDEHDADAQCDQDPVVPGHGPGARIEFAQHSWPEIATELRVHRGKRLFQGFTNLVVVEFGHLACPHVFSAFIFLTLMFWQSGLHLNRCKRLRRMRTERKTRSLTAPTDVPKASAIWS